ncbi:MAG: hypothetical protein NT172_10570 [Planctomycetota bacterium]|nr:hypothetical protein [Planctomycetota bacterium]
MNPFTTLMTSLSSFDQTLVLTTLDAFANAATVTTALGINDTIRNLIQRIIGPRNEPVTPPPPAQPTQIDAIMQQILCFDLRIAELETAVSLLQIKSLAIQNINSILINQDNIKIVRLAIQEAILSGINVIEPNDLNLLPNGGQRNRFLYLASNNYANSMSTLNFAIHNNFLWRSYFAKLNRRTHVYPRIAHVEEIQNGDIIVLAFRENGHFKVLSPLVVATENLDNMAAIAGMNDIPNLSPFVSVQDPNLNGLLAGIGGYGPDPNLGVRTGLPVKLLNTNFSTPAAINVYNTLWPSPPGINALWNANGQNAQEEYYLPEPVRNWMNTL